MYRFELNAVPVTCDTVEELHAAVAVMPPPTPKVDATPTRKKASARKAATRKDSGSKVKQSWDRAKELAKREGISVPEARSRLAAQKG